MYFGFDDQYYSTKWMTKKPWLEIYSSAVHYGSSASPLLFFIYIYLLRCEDEVALRSARAIHQCRGSTNTDAVLLGTVNRPVAPLYADCLTKASDEFA